MILAIIIGVVLEGAAALWALKWAMPKSNRTFFSVFVGDAMLRLIGLALATYWLWTRHLPFTGPLVTLAFAYLLLSLIQIPFFYKVR